MQGEFRSRQGRAVVPNAERHKTGLAGVREDIVVAVDVLVGGLQDGEIRQRKLLAGHIAREADEIVRHAVEVVVLRSRRIADVTQTVAVVIELSIRTRRQERRGRIGDVGAVVHSVSDPVRVRVVVHRRAGAAVAHDRLAVAARRAVGAAGAGERRIVAAHRRQRTFGVGGRRQIGDADAITIAGVAEGVIIRVGLGVVRGQDAVVGGVRE